MKTIFAAALIFAAAFPAVAQDHNAHKAPAAITATADPAAAGYKAAMDKMMMTTMSNKPSGSADIDFVRGMIPHHQAAIDMAKVQLQFGKDTEIRKLSEEIISAQEKEIADMEAWLEKNAK